MGEHACKCIDSPFMLHAVYMPVKACMLLQHCYGHGVCCTSVSCAVVSMTSLLEQVCCARFEAGRHQHKQVRRSSSLVGLRELAELSRQQRLVPDQGTRQLPAAWEQELLKMKVVSSGFSRPSSSASDRSVERPDAPRPPPPTSLETSLTAALARLSPTPRSVPLCLETTVKTSAPSDQQQQPILTTSNSFSQDQLLDLSSGARKSITSPFLVAAQKFYTSTSQLQTTDQHQDASPEPSLTPSPDQDQAANVPELSAEPSAGEQEAVLLSLGEGITYEPDDRFSLDKCDPRMDMRHSLATTPVSPQPVDRFLTADSFKNEPGQTLFDCTDPTPNQSTDLDDAALKARLAPFLPNLSSPSGKRIRRQLSSQFNGFNTWSKSRHHAAPNPDPSAISSADAELGVIDERGSLRGSATGQGERGHSMQSTGEADI